MDGSMDIDMDVDMGDDEDIIALEAEAMRIEAQPPSSPQLSKEAASIASSAISNSDSLQLTPHKVHVRGLDNLTTEDINGFAKEFFTEDQPSRIEWIDDTSANLVYQTPATALKALTSFSAIANEEPSTIPTSQLRPAKHSPVYPDTHLHVRLATINDVKSHRASDKSRFYLLHPEHDPREKRRREGGRSRNERHYGNDNRDFRRRRYDDREDRRRRDGDHFAGFSADLYDDATNTLSREDMSDKGRRDSQASISSGEARVQPGRTVRIRGHSDKDLFEDRVRADNGRLRDRSASPGKDRNWNDDALLASKTPTRSKLRDRSYSPPLSNRNTDSQSHRENNAGKELISFVPTLKPDISAELRGSSSANYTKELFADGPPSTYKKELFPKKVGTSNHRRTDAFDAADETADLFATGMAVTFTDGASDRRSKPRDVANRITKAPSSTFRRLQDGSTTPEDPPADMMEGGYSIRGAANQQDQGFSIRGAAGDAAANQTVKELFPGKVGGNAAKELFADKLKGRGGRRRKAEDMFY